MTFFISQGFAELQILNYRTEWNIMMKFCIHIDIDMMQPMR